MNPLNDRRNVIDQFKGWSEMQIIDYLDEHGSLLEIAIENVERDFNMGTIVRSANAFGVRHVHVIGRRQWNKRGAMMTDKYLHVKYHASSVDFLADVHSRDYSVVAVDNVEGARPIEAMSMPERTVLVVGSEGQGISPKLLKQTDITVAISQYGSTRSLNVGVAAGIAMFEWSRQHKNTLELA